MPTYLTTFTGLEIDPLNPRVEQIRIVDIAHSLALTNRFGGHTARPVSVAQHSLHVMQLVPQEFKLEALLHDAAEAYVGDLIYPLKIICPNFQQIEEGFTEVICERFKLPNEKSDEVAEADLMAQRFEAETMNFPGVEKWDLPKPSRNLKWQVMTWRQVQQEFLNAFVSVGGGTWKSMSQELVGFDIHGE